MSAFKRWFPRLWSLTHRRQMERELAEEMAFHLEMEAAKLAARGLPAEDARRAATHRFGGVEGVKEECREESGILGWERLRQDLRFTLRSLSHNPGFAAAVIATLGLGIGANTAIFSVVESVLLAPLPYPDGDRLVVLRQQAPGFGVDDAGLSIPELADYRAGARSLAGAVEYHQMSFNLLGRGEPLRVETGVVSAAFFQLFGIEPLLGRTFLPADEEHGAEPVLVLSHGFWRTALGADPAVVGKTFEMNDRVHTVVGVLPPVPLYPEENEVYMATSACPFRSAPGVSEDRNARGYAAIARLQPGVTLETARVDLGALAARMEQEHPEAYPAGSRFGVRVLSLAGEITREARTTFLVLLATVGLLLTAAAANAANLILARLLSRDGELALRAALGASRRRLLRQIVTETTLLSLAGGVLGIGIAAAGKSLLVAYASRFTPRAQEVRVGPETLLFTLLVALVTGVALGAVCAFQVSRRGLLGRLKEGSGSPALGARGGVRGVLMCAQLAIVVVLAIGAGLMAKSLVKLHRVDPGFDPRLVTKAAIDLDWAKRRDDAGRRDFYLRLLAELEPRPWAQAVALASEVPLGGDLYASQLRIEGRPANQGDPASRKDVRIVSPAYFRALSIPLLSGRAFTAGDSVNAPQVAIVSRSLARHVWGEEDPLGARIVLGSDDGVPRTIVGVVGDVKQYGLDREAREEIYLPLAQDPTLSAALLVRTTADPGMVEREIRQAVYRIDPEQPVFDVRTLEALRRDSVASPQLTTTLLGLFALLAGAITLVGMTGLLAFSVRQRRHEIGIRMALGAEKLGITALVLRQGLGLLGVGLGVGLAGGFAVSRLFKGLLFAVEPHDPSTYASVALLLVIAAAAACWLPARRAAGIQPVTVLKEG